MRSIALLQQLIADEGRPGHHYRNRLFARVQALKVHRVEGGEALAALGAGTKTQTQWPFLSMLFDRGVEAADRWLHENRRHIGQRSTLDLVQAFGA